MYKTMLIATDGSETAQKGIDHGIALAKALGTKIVVVTVTEPWTAIAPGEAGMAFPIDDYEKQAEEAANKILAKVDAQAKAANVPCETVYIRDQFPAEGIVETAKNKGVDVIVIGSHGRRGLSRLLLGSQANKVVTHTGLPVLIVR